MNFFVEHFIRTGRPILVQPGVASISHDREEPCPHVATLVAVEKTERAQAGFLRNVLRVLIVPRQPAREVVRSVQVRQDGLLEALASRCLWHPRVCRCSLVPAL